jgi:hypothetical protein
MDIEWDSLADRYVQLIKAGPKSQLELTAIDDFLGKAASAFPRGGDSALAWFVAALTEPPRKWFVAKILERVNPVPRTLLAPLLMAALGEPNPSANRVFVEPCVRTFGAQAVKARLNELAMQSEENDGESLANALYWVGRSR